MRSFEYRVIIFHLPSKLEENKYIIKEIEYESYSLKAVRYKIRLA